jgi:hypothetical protein
MSFSIFEIYKLFRSFRCGTTNHALRTQNEKNILYTYFRVVCRKPTYRTFVILTVTRPHPRPAARSTLSAPNLSLR